MRVKILIASLVILFSANAMSSTSASTVSASDLILGKFNTYSRTDRMIIAKDILEKINALDSLVPNPTPNDLLWINTETEALKDSSTFTRRMNFIESAEFQEYKFKNHLKAMKYALVHIIDTNNVSSEMANWALLSSGLIDKDTIDDAIEVLKSHQKIPNYIGSDNDNKTMIASSVIGYSNFYHLWGEGILTYILIPYLSETTHPDDTIAKTWG